MTSYYIQDLRLVLPTEVFELRVNKHCANVNALFREWLYQPLCGDLTQAEDLFKHRFDLLCSLCFPTIDPPQLLRISKLCALVVLASDGLIQVENTSPAGRSSRDSTSHPDLLNPEHLLGVARSIRTGRAQELQYPPPTYLSANVLLRLTGSLLSSFYSSQQTSTQNPHPGLPEFLAVLESAYDHKFSEELTNATLETLWGYAVNILTWCQDLASYASLRPHDYGQCTVCHLITGRCFTLQGAVNNIRQNLQSEVEKFAREYKSLVAQTPDNKDSATVAGAMRNCVAGFIHWIYESERYFGKRNEEVAKFGWVFMDTDSTSADSDGLDVP